MLHSSLLVLYMSNSQKVMTKSGYDMYGLFRLKIWKMLANTYMYVQMRYIILTGSVKLTKYLVLELLLENDFA